MNSKAFETNNSAVTIDDGKIEQLYNAYADTVFRIAYVRTLSQSDADDIVQEVFLRMLRTNSIFDDEERQKAWLIRVAVNCSNSLTSSSHRRRNISESELFADTADPSQSPQEADSRADVSLAVMRLPQKQRTAVHLYYYQGYKAGEIAEMMGVRENTVKSWLNRARKSLEKQLKGAEF